MKWYQERSKEPYQRFEQLYEVDSSGNLKALNKFEWMFTQRSILPSPQEKFRKALTKISPPFYDLFGKYFFWFFWKPLFNQNRSLYEFINFLLHFAPSYNPLSYLLSLLMAGIVFIHAWPRRTSKVGLIAWVVFAALFNIVGLLVYLALNYTPTVKCHKCGKRRGMNTPQCPHCSADLSTNAPDKPSIIAVA